MDRYKTLSILSLFWSQYGKLSLHTRSLNRLFFNPWLTRQSAISQVLTLTVIADKYVMSKNINTNGTESLCPVEEREGERDGIWRAKEIWGGRLIVWAMTKKHRDKKKELTHTHILASFSPTAQCKSYRGFYSSLSCRRCQLLKRLIILCNIPLRAGQGYYDQRSHIINADRRMCSSNTANRHTPLSLSVALVLFITQALLQGASVWEMGLLKLWLLDAGLKASKWWPNTVPNVLYTKVSFKGPVYEI